MNETITLDQQSRVIESIVKHSFRLSRGSDKAQQQILKYVGKNIGLPLEQTAFVRALEPTYESCLAISRSSAHVRLQRDPYISIVAADHETHDAVAGYLETLEKAVFNPSVRLDPTFVAIDLLNADKKWLPASRVSLPERSQPIHAYASNILLFGFVGETTGIPVYDAMFKTVAEAGLPEAIERHRADERAFSDVNPSQWVTEVFQGHTVTHPEHAEVAIEALASLGLATKAPTDIST